MIPGENFDTQMPNILVRLYTSAFLLQAYKNETLR